MKFISRISLIVLVLLTLTASVTANEFIRGFFSCSPMTDENFAMLKDAGINYIHIYSGSADSESGLKQVERTLKLAEKYGLKVMINFKSSSMKKRQDYIEIYRKYIRRFKNYPAVGSWYIADEPSVNEYERVKAIYNLVKQEDKKHPVMLCTDWMAGWYKFRHCTDYQLLDLYPVRSAKFPNAPLNDYAKFILAGTQLPNGKPIIGIVQAMNWRSYYKSAVELKNHDKKNLRYPNRIELRYLCYSTIAQAGKGLFFYSFYDIIVRDKNRPFFLKNIKPIILEIKKFNELTNGAKIKRLVDNNTNGKLPPFFATTFTNSHGTYLVFTNNTKLEINKFQAKIVLPQGNYQFIPLAGTEHIPVEYKNNKLKIENVAPWESFIWKLIKK